MNMERFPKKFRRHCWNLFRFVLFSSLTQMVIEQLRQLDLIEHYWLVESCFLAICVSIITWFVWRAYVGMERDMDFFDDF